MAMSNAMARFLSRPMGVEWAGWRTDTLMLQQSGWEIAVERDAHWMTYRLLLKHRMMHLYAITHVETVNNYMDVQSGACDPSRLPVFRIQHVAPRMEVIRMNEPSFNFQQIDAQPTCTFADVQSIEDMNIFNVPLTRAEEILIDDADMTVIEHLQAIKELQSEDQKRIRRDILKNGARPEGASMDYSPQATVHANLISLNVAT